MKIITQVPKKALNKAYLKEKVNRADVEAFKKNLLTLFNSLERKGDEEHLKTQVTYFLRDTWYKDKYQINPIEKNDLAIHTGKAVSDPIGVLLEVKSITNTAEMITAEKPNTKALHELILYYLRERIDKNNNEIKYLIATSIEDWYLFDANEFDKKIFRNSVIKKLYEIKKRDHKDNPFFYEELKRILQADNITLEATTFRLNDYRKVVTNTDKEDDKKLLVLYKLLSPVHLLKQPFANDSNSLDTKFYAELLHIIGLEEVKDGSKKLIRRKAKPDHASLLENTIQKLKDYESLRNIARLGDFGDTTEERLYNVALELCITWVNRILFLKLLEAQLVTYNKGNREYTFLNTDFIFDFDELSNLFFGVLAERPAQRREDLKVKYERVPYLNSSLFERTELERTALNISSLDNRLQLPLHTGTVLKNEVDGKRLTGQLGTLAYLFCFLDAYDFTSEGAEEIQEENKNLINASVLGLIFEKINGYKDGSFFTPGFVTMYMCRETIRRAVVQKFNEVKGWSCKEYDELFDKIEDKKQANTIINSLTICDPAVGSGHFLVSALNELIAIKSDLKILLDRQGKTLRDYEVVVENDELIVIDDNGDPFEYNYHNRESQRVQEALFHEKETLIERCLFGVDINPNSVKICRLRLWIELLKHAYYTADSNYTQLETLPNIDINIKTGNSLISRFALDADITKALSNSGKWNIESYKLAVQAYRDAQSKEEKRVMEELIEIIKKDFRSTISPNDVKFKKLSKLRSELLPLTTTKELFSTNDKSHKDTKKKIESLTKEIAKLEAEVEEIKNNKIYENAFEWRFEFPEVLDGEGKFVGFDVLIGNPPYVQLQKMSVEIKVALERQQFKTFTRTGDLYQLFYELGINVLRNNGKLCFITSNKWMRTDYGGDTRGFLAKECLTEMLVDFGMAQMFDTATTYTNILLASKQGAYDLIPMCRIKDDYRGQTSLKEYITTNTVEIDNPSSNSWIVYDKKEYDLIKRIEAQGIPLRNWNIQINYGIKTGCNEAFIIDTETRDRIVAEDPCCAEIIKPILRGEDIKAYMPYWANKWIIGTFPSLNIDISTYPSIERYLGQFKKRLEPKPKAFEGKWEGRKSGSYKWFETQDSISYYEEFTKPKIIYPNMTKYMPFVYDKRSFFCNQKCFIVTGYHLGYLTAFLNTKLFRFAFKEYFPELLGDTRELSKVFFETVSVKQVDDNTNNEFCILVDEIQNRKENGIDTIDIETEIENKIASIYGLSDIDKEIINSQNL